MFLDEDFHLFPHCRVNNQVRVALYGLLAINTDDGQGDLELHNEFIGLLPLLQHGFDLRALVLLCLLVAQQLNTELQIFQLWVCFPDLLFQHFQFMHQVEKHLEERETLVYLIVLDGVARLSTEFSELLEQVLREIGFGLRSILDDLHDDLLQELGFLQDILLHVALRLAAIDQQVETFVVDQVIHEFPVDH
jgi:hypothetical protein